MKKQRVSPTISLTPSVSKDSFSNMPKLPSVQDVAKNVATANDVKEDKPQIERNKRKRETAKGTILQAVMIEKDLLKLVKHNAFYNEKSISEVINQALRLHFD
jgi:hypothetical protein